MLKINLQLFAEGDTIPEEKKEANPTVEKEPSAIFKAFGLKPKQPAKEPEKKPDEKPKEEVKPEKPDEAKKLDTMDDKAKQEPEFYEIPYMKDKDGKQQTVKIPFAERDTYLQKGYNHDKVKAEAVSLKTTLQRVAKMEGFKTVDEYLAELDKREKAKLAEKIEEAAGDPDKINEIVENHPKVIETREKDRKNVYRDTKAELSKDQFFKELEPELDRLMEQNPTAAPDLVYNVIRSKFLTPDKIKELITKEKESAVKATIADIHDKEKRATPTGGDTDEGKDTVTPTAFANKLANVFGVSAAKIAQRTHEKMKRS